MISCTNGAYFRAVDLSTGRLKQFEGTELVKIIHAELIIR